MKQKFSVLTVKKKFRMARSLRCVSTPLCVQDLVGSVNSLHDLALSKILERRITTPIVQRIEEEFFSGNLEWMSPSNPNTDKLYSTGLISTEHRMSFREFVRSLPMSHKAILMGPLSSGSPEDKLTISPPDVKALWQNRDPVDMESVERDHYLKTGEVLRTRKLDPKIRPMRPGSRLSQELGMYILENIDTLSVPDLGLFLTALWRSSPNSIFHRDLKLDAQFTICKRLLSLSDEEIGPIVLPVCLALNRFASSLEAPSRVMRRKILPLIRRGTLDVDSNVPREFSGWNTESRRALLVAEIIKSGRFRMSPRVLRSLGELIEGQVGALNEESIAELLKGFSIAGCISEPLVHELFKKEGMSLKTVVELIGVGDQFSMSIDRQDVIEKMASMVETNPVDSWPISEQLRLLNCLASIETDAVDRLAKRVIGRLPDFEIELLGK
jgi:hypothetical protein